MLIKSSFLQNGRITITEYNLDGHGKTQCPSNRHVKEVNSVCQGKQQSRQTSLQLISQSIMNPLCSRNWKAVPDCARTCISIIIWKSSSICQRYGTTLSHCQQFSGGKKVGRQRAVPPEAEVTMFQIQQLQMFPIFALKRKSTRQ